MADPAIEVLQIEVAKLALAPGDVLVVKVPPGPMEEAGAWGRLNEWLRLALPDAKILVMTKDIDLSIVQAPAADGG